MATAAEEKARKFLLRTRERISRTGKSGRYTAEIRVEHHDYPQNSTSAIVTVRDSLSGGSLWAQWYSMDDRPRTARFLGGRYHYSYLSARGHRIRKSYRKLWDAVNTIVY